MLTIRLLRVGKKNQPSFRIVITDKKNPPRGGRFIEIVGFYNPLTKERNLKQERIKYWLSVGAQPSDTIYNLLVSEKIIEGKKTPLHKKKKEPSVAPASAEATAGKEAKPGEKKEEPVMEKAEAESPKKEPEKEEEPKEPEKPKEEKPKEKPKEEKKAEEPKAEKKSKEKPKEKTEEKKEEKGSE